MICNIEWPKCMALKWRDEFVIKIVDLNCLMLNHDFDSSTFFIRITVITARHRLVKVKNSCVPIVLVQLYNIVGFELSDIESVLINVRQSRIAQTRSDYVTPRYNDVKETYAKGFSQNRKNYTHCWS